MGKTLEQRLAELEQAHEAHEAEIASIYNQFAILNERMDKHEQKHGPQLQPAARADV